MSIGLIAALIFLRRGKKLGFGKTLGVMAVGALVGLALGSLAEALVDVNSATGMGFASPMVIISSGILVGVWLAVAFLE